MKKLFETTEIKSLVLANRSVRSATWSGVGDEQGFVTDNAVALYESLAEGGVGLIVTGYQYVMTNGQQSPFMLGNYDQSHVPGLQRLASAVHAKGGKIIPQLVHCGTLAGSKFFRPGDELWGPSAIVGPGGTETPKEMTPVEIRQLVEAYAAAAARSQEAGFDGIQLHGAHGYGLNQFISGAWNKRGDAYGGSTEKRYRFLGEVLEAVRAAVGRDFPVLIKLSGHDYVPEGLEPQGSVIIAKRLVDDGIDAIEVSGGNGASAPEKSPARKKIKKPGDEAYLSDISAFFKEHCTVPIMTVGGIRSRGTVDTVLAEGKADHVSLARPLVREPHLIKRWHDGDNARAACISCNKCFKPAAEGTGIYCVVDRERASGETTD